MSIRPATTSILNALGDSYQKLGDSHKARQYLERSLELNPNPQAIKEQLSSLPKSE